jgi:hypothetical protein
MDVLSTLGAADVEAIRAELLAWESDFEAKHGRRPAQKDLMVRPAFARLPPCAQPPVDPYGIAGLIMAL